MAEQDKLSSPEEETRPLVLLSSSPHIASPVNSRPLMANVLLALMPVTVFGVVLFGLGALLTVLVSVAAAVAAESLFRCITRQAVRAADLSAAVTGLLLALVLPPSTPLWMTALGAAFSVIVAKEFFGGLGANVFNPALIGRAFLLMSFPAAVTPAAWPLPRGLNALLGRALPDAVSAATPLRIMKSAALGGMGGTMQTLGEEFVQSKLSAAADYWSAIKTLFIGNHSGSIGESSIILIIAGGLLLLFTKTIDWRTPAAMIGTSCIAAWAFRMDPLFCILSGGIFFGAVFMATDYVSTPVTPKGKLIFGAGAGLIAVLIRKWGSYPEGVTYGILMMNAASPFLNRFLPKKYGYVPKPKGGKQ
ncbi:MAG: RnfABCDGE type electron transport complex subunit D [Treponema sp.]|nr:RnfABCDGE type electron transport complex subunit D [Treponema sp.]